jgi:EAL domain-containing protein (putative c-di-GMP-specific phosphodiesterase class I)
MLRWHHPGLGLLWPEQFLPDAEAGGFGPTLAVGLLLAAAREAATWPAPARPVWVELTATSLADEVIGRATQLARDAEGLGAGSMGLHLPASGLHRDGVAIVHRLDEARGAGVRLGISGVVPQDADEVLQHRPDELILHAEVVRQLPDRADVREAVAGLVARAHGQGCRVSGLGVETWREVESLLVVHADAAVGYLFGGPQRADRLKWVLDEDNAEGAWRGSYLADKDMPEGYRLPWAEPVGAKPFASIVEA